MRKKATTVCSGKGGTGKTVVALNIAQKLKEHGPTALLDFDLDNSNFCQMTQVNSSIAITEDHKFKPYKWNDVEVFSMSLLGSRTQSVSMEASRYVQILDDVVNRSIWNSEFFVIDMPAGSSKEILGNGIEIVADYLAGSIIVTQPNMTDSARRILKLHEYFEIPVLGLIENMSYFQGDAIRYYPFGRSTVDEIAKEFNVKVLGKIPLSEEITKGIEKGDPTLVGELGQPVENAVKEFLAVPIQTPGFWVRMKETVSEALKGEIEKVLIHFIVTINQVFNVNAIRTSSGFRDSRPFLFVITDETGSKEITSVAMRVTEDTIKVIRDPKELDFQIATDFHTLARMIMGQRKTRHGDYVPYSPEDAWYHGDVKCYGLGYTARAVKVFRTIFQDEPTMNKMRSRFGAVLKSWI